MEKKQIDNNNQEQPEAVFETVFDFLIKERTAGLATKPSQQQTAEQAPTPRVEPKEAITYGSE